LTHAENLVDLLAPTTAHGPLDLPSLRGLTILIVDDNDDALELLTTFLNACHADVLSARTATGALA
jgi:hypothetical protein